MTDARSQPGNASDILLDLADRCEKATGADRQLDRMIEETFPGVERHMYAESVRDGYVISGQGHSTYGAGQAYLPPHYTTSTDAAATLAPEGAEWECGTANLIHAAWASVVTDVNSKGKARTPALALCAAALRARSKSS